MGDDEIGKLFSTVSFLAKGIVKALDAKGLNIGQNNGRAASQIIPSCPCSHNPEIQL